MPQPRFNANIQLPMHRRQLIQEFNKISPVSSTSVVPNQMEMMNMKQNQYWIPPQSSQITSMSFSRPTGPLPSTVRHYPPNTLHANVVYVRPLGAPKTVENNHNISQNLQDSIYQMMSRPSKPLGPAAVIRGLSPQNNVRTKTYPSYVVRNPMKLEINPEIFPGQKNLGTPFAQSPIITGLNSNAEQIVQRIKKDLSRTSANPLEPPGASGSTSIFQRVRMGWSPAKRKIYYLCYLNYDYFYRLKRSSLLSKQTKLKGK